MAEEELKQEVPQFIYCEACGRRIFKDDLCGKDKCNTWCKECCNSDGSHKNKEDVKKNIAKFIMSIEGHRVMGEKLENQEEALKLAEEFMKKMPAWSEENTETKL
jgi:hypothetical protein